VHAGFAIQKIDESAAQETLSLLREAAELVEKKEGERR
jgi:hydrogenase maturation factor